jgi:hypothetical protein
MSEVKVEIISDSSPNITRKITKNIRNTEIPLLIPGFWAKNLIFLSCLLKNSTIGKKRLFTRTRPILFDAL